VITVAAPTSTTTSARPPRRRAPSPASSPAHINEAHAAALATGSTRRTDRHPGFDLGGGTFACRSRNRRGVFEGQSTAGNTHSAGDDWDQRVIDWLVSEFKNAHGNRPGKDQDGPQRRRRPAEKDKERAVGDAGDDHQLRCDGGRRGPVHLESKLTGRSSGAHRRHPRRGLQGPLRGGHPGLRSTSRAIST